VSARRAQLRGCGSDGPPPGFSETEEAVLACGGAGAAPAEALAAWRLRARARLGRLSRLEQAPPPCYPTLTPSLHLHARRAAPEVARLCDGELPTIVASRFCCWQWRRDWHSVRATGVMVC